jgi:hypothetical protein
MVRRKNTSFLCTDEKMRRQIQVDRRSGYNLCTIEKSAFHTAGVGRTKGKGATTTIYCSNTSSGEHSISSRKK